MAGKSKGCSTCRRRKKGCDLGRPECGQCVKRGDVCGGYERDITFIHHKLSAKDHQPSSASKTSPMLDSFCFHDYEPLTAALDGTSSWTHSGPEHSSTSSADQSSRESSVLVEKQDPHSSSLQLLSPSFSLTALTTLHTSLFNSLYLPRNSFAIQRSGPFGHPANWTQFIPTLLNNDTGLQFAYLALSSSLIGHDNGDDDLVAATKKFYGKALREMQRALTDPKRRHTEETLLACSTLSLYEIFEAQAPAAVQTGSAPNGWLSHAAGVARLLEARGPESYTTIKGHPIFLHARILIAIRASTARKACFLSEPQWLTIPWRNNPKNMLHRLVDVMVFLPVKMENYDTLESNLCLDMEQRQSGRQSLLLKCNRLCEQLQEWYTQLCDAANGGPLWNVSISDDSSYPFPLLFSFDEPLLGYAITLYWTCSLIIHGTILQLQHLLNQDLAGPNKEETLLDHINPEMYALNIAQAISYFLHPDMGALGPNMALFPLGMVVGFFAAPSRPCFVADWINMESANLKIDGLLKEEDSSIDKSSRDILLWFISMFDKLSSRRMPGGAFLLGLMEAMAAANSRAGLPSVSKV